MQLILRCTLTVVAYNGYEEINGWVSFNFILIT